MMLMMMMIPDRVDAIESLFSFKPTSERMSLIAPSIADAGTDFKTNDDDDNENDDDHDHDHDT